MSTQELIAEIQKLPESERQRLLVALKRNERQIQEPLRPMSEDEVEQILFAEGIIGEIPDPAVSSDDDEDFEPIEVQGKPLSETILEERR